MNEGIIQEVIRKSLLDNFGIQEKIYLDCSCGYCSLARDIQEELIEIINNSFEQFNSWDRDLIQRILRGNQ